MDDVRSLSIGKAKGLGIDPEPLWAICPSRAARSLRACQPGTGMTSMSKIHSGESEK